MSEPVRAALARVAERLGAGDVLFTLERPRDTGHGDLATNVAMLVAKRQRTNPRALAEQVISMLDLPGTVVRKTEVAGPGFINFWLAGDALAGDLQRVLDQGAAFGRNDSGQGARVNVEFVSANPTGPLHVGHGRGAALGDVIASLLEWTGHEVTREFYVNDAGVQIDKLAGSLYARVRQYFGLPGTIPEGGYHGAYLIENAKEVAEKLGRHLFESDELLVDAVLRCREAALKLQRAEQDRDLKEFGVEFKEITSEQWLYDEGKVTAALALLADRGLTYEQDGALWLRTSQFGDDKDRVLRKQDGSFTYLVPDIAYHVGKHERGFAHAIDVWGADHHGYIPRMRAVLVALGLPADFFDVELVQLVRVVRGGEEVRMSKRSGEFVTLRDLYEEVGVDAARWFFLALRGDTQMVFDVDLAKKQTNDNPVFYVQMAHARLSGIFRTAERAPESATGPVALEDLPSPHDTALLKRLVAFPEHVARAARDREPHQVASYLHDLAGEVHGWYHHTRTVGEPAPVEAARLCLARAARIVLANGLALLGISAPDRM